MTEEETNETRRQAEEDRQANYEKLLAAGIEPTEARLQDMMYESLARRLKGWIQDAQAS